MVKTYLLRTKSRLWPVLTAAALAVAASGCSGNECYENHSALPLASFYSSASLQPVSIVRLQIYGIGAPGDSILYPPQTLGEAYLPFRLWQDTTQYVLAYTGMIPDSIATEFPEAIPRDTLTFVYRPKEWFVSPACGAMYFYDMDTVCHTSLLIDSVSYNDVITNANIANIKIFFKEVGDE